MDPDVSNGACTVQYILRGSMKDSKGRVRKFSNQQKEQATKWWSDHLNALSRLKSTEYKLQAECGIATLCLVILVLLPGDVCVLAYTFLSSSFILFFFHHASFVFFFSFTKTFFSSHLIQLRGCLACYFRQVDHPSTHFPSLGVFLRCHAKVARA